MTIEPLLIPVSPGELFDKISILQIKSERLRHPEQRAHVRHELAQLRPVEHACRQRHPTAAAVIEAASHQLKAVNERLWDIEDAVRRCEQTERFDVEFIALARQVYMLNDQRFALKRTINQALQADIVEEKSYASG